MTWLLYTGSAVVLLAVLNVLQRSVAAHSPNPRASSVIFNLIAATMAGVLFLAEGGYHHLMLPSNLLPWVFIGLAFVSYGLFERFRFHTAKNLEAGTLTVISNWSFVVGFFGSLLLYQEQILLSQWMGVGLILASALIVSWPHSSKISVTKVGLAYGFLTSSLIGIAQIFDKVGAVNFSPGLYSILMWTMPILVIIFPKISIQTLKKELARSSKPTTIMALLNVAGYYLYLKALTTAPAIQVIPILQTYSILVVILAAIFLRERDRLWLKLGAVVLALIGLSLVT